MHYYLDINGTVFGNVSEFEIAEAYRNETVAYSLGGNITVERTGSAKTKLSATINMLTQEEMDALKNAVQLATATIVKYYQGNELRTKNMRIAPFVEPSPLYFFGDRTKGYRYGSVDLEMEEV